MRGSKPWVVSLEYFPLLVIIRILTSMEWETTEARKNLRNHWILTFQVRWLKAQSEAQSHDVPMAPHPKNGRAGPRIQSSWKLLIPSLSQLVSQFKLLEHLHYAKFEGLGATQGASVPVLVKLGETDIEQMTHQSFKNMMHAVKDKYRMLWAWSSLVKGIREVSLRKSQFRLRNRRWRRVH